jgi:hypothetical protein
MIYTGTAYLGSLGKATNKLRVLGSIYTNCTEIKGFLMIFFYSLKHTSSRRSKDIYGHRLPWLLGEGNK